MGKEPPRGSWNITERYYKMVRLILSENCVVEYKRISKADRELLLGILVDHMDADYNEAVTKVNEIAKLASKKKVYQVTVE
jgi:hypothetical protein